jgi:hypothetical protein
LTEEPSGDKRKIRKERKKLKGQTRLLAVISLSLFATGFITPGFGFTAATSPTAIKGILMDQMCSGKADLRISGASGLLEGGRIVAEAHTRECALMPQCEKSGYGVYTDDNKFLKFDAAGNRKALAAIKASTKLDDLEVEVTGDVKDDTIKVVSLKIIP